MMSRLSCVVMSFSVLLLSSGFRVKPKKKQSSPTANEGRRQTLEDRLRQKAMKMNGAIDLDVSLKGKGDPAPTPAPAPPESPRVFTLGDSYSSGVGIHRSANSYEGGDCWRDWRTTAGAQLAAGVGMPYVNNACSGGEIPEIYGQFEEIKARHPDLAQTGFNGSTIVFTIAGNDLRTNKGDSWPGLLTSCILSFYGPCHEDQENQIANWDDLQARAWGFYMKIAREAPNAKIRILGYPRLMQRRVFCIAVPLLNFGTADWADRQVDELNRRLRIATNDVRSAFASAALEEETTEDRLRQRVTEKLSGAVKLSALDASLSRKGDDPAPAPAPPPPPSSVDIEFVDVSSYFTRGACRVFRREVNSIVLDGFSLSDSSFHPSQRGYNKYFEALANNVGLAISASLPSPMDELVDNETFQHIYDGWDTNGDGKLDLDECLAMAAQGDELEVASSQIDEQGRTFFQQADNDKDGFLDLAEFEEFSALVEAAEEATL